MFPGEAGGQSHGLYRHWLPHSKRRLPATFPLPTPSSPSGRQQLWVTLSRDGYFPQELVPLPRTERTIFGQGILTRQEGKQQEKDPQDPPALLVGVALSKREGTLLLPRPKVGTHICQGSI